MIKTLSFPKLRNSEHLQFNKAVMHVCEEHNPETLHIKAQYDAFKEINDKIESIFVKARGNVLTQDIINQDDLRDASIVGFTLVLRAYTNHYLPEKEKAALVLLSHIRKYGTGIADMNFMAETAVLDDLIDGIETEQNLTDAATLLGLSDWLTEMKVQNTEFNRLYELRAESEAAKSKLNLRDLRNEAIDRYRDLIRYLQAASIMHPDPIYDIVMNQLNEFIDKYNILR